MGRIVDPSDYDKKWHKWFAWYPVTVDDKRIWMRSIFRYGTYNSLHGFRTEKHLIEPEYYYKYAETVFDILK